MRGISPDYAHCKTKILQVKLHHRIRRCATGALTRLGLARVSTLEGDTPKARAAYQDFLTVWKDADSEIPILKQAKAEYAKLQ